MNFSAGLSSTDICLAGSPAYDAQGPFRVTGDTQVARSPTEIRPASDCSDTSARIAIEYPLDA